MNDSLRRHPALRQFASKIGKDNVLFLASALAWSFLTSIAPIAVGLTAITGVVLRSAGLREQVLMHLSALLQNVLSWQDLNGLVDAAVRHAGLLGIIGLLGVVWGGSNVGTAVSTVFQPIFQVSGRPLLVEKLIDIGMIFIFTVLMLVIIAATTAGAVLGRMSAGMAAGGATQFAIGTVISLIAGFVLFATVYLVFPNVQPRFKLRNVWVGASVAAVLFQLLTYVWPLYASLVHFQRYGAVIAPIIVLTAWIYFLAVVLLIGAEIVSFQALRDARAERQPIGPAPNDIVPQRVRADERIDVERRPAPAKPGQAVK